MNTTHHPSAFAPYLRHGFCLVPVMPGGKGPNHPGWNTKDACITSSSDIPPDYGAGLGHAYSGTCAIDIDDLFVTSMVFAERGLNLQDYLDAPDAVQINSGRPGSGKLLYRLADPLPSKKIVLLKKTVFEFRSGTSNGMTVQDLLPPSRHPSGTTYQWAGRGDWHHLPELPLPILFWWHELLTAQEPTAKTPSTVTGGVPLDQAASMLTRLDADCTRDEWRNYGMALHAEYEGSAEAFDVWDTWSATALEKYSGRRECAVQWASFKAHPNGIGIGSIIQAARQQGWQAPPIDVSELFKEVVPLDVADMLVTGNPVPSMTLSLFPKVLADYAIEVSDTAGASTVIPIMAGLSAAAAAADARSTLTLKDGMVVPPVIWCMTVASPSAKKTPSSRPMFAPLHAIERDDAPRYQAELLRWQAVESAHLSAMKAYTAASANPAWLAGGADHADLPGVPVLPTKPVPKRLQVQDSTSQKLAYLCADRPQGMACILDEGAGWLNKVTDNSSGENRSTWTQSYESQPHYFDRVGTGSLYIENLAISMYMNVQPAVIGNYMSGSTRNAQDDGLIQRFLPGIIPDSEASRVGVGRPAFLSHSAAWESALRRIHAATAGGRHYRIDSESDSVLLAFEHWLEKLKSEERMIASDAGLQSAIGKILGQVGRVIFILHLLENPDNPVVPYMTVNAAIDWIKGYTIPAMRHFYALGDKHASLEQWVTEHVLTGDEEIISVSDVMRAARRPLDRMQLSGWRANELIESVMILLAHAGWLKAVALQTGEKSPRYAVNQSVRVQFAGRRKIVARIKQDRIEESRAIAIAHRPGMPIKRNKARGIDFNDYDAA